MPMVGSSNRSNEQRISQNQEKSQHKVVEAGNPLLEIARLLLIFGGDESGMCPMTGVFPEQGASLPPNRAQALA